MTEQTRALADRIDKALIGGQRRFLLHGAELDWVIKTLRIYAEIAALEADNERLRRLNAEARLRDGELRAERDALRAALTDAMNSLYNGFEPENQSYAYLKAKRALEQKEDRHG